MNSDIEQRPDTIRLPSNPDELTAENCAEAFAVLNAAAFVEALRYVQRQHQLKALSETDELLTDE